MSCSPLQFSITPSRGDYPASSQHCGVNRHDKYNYPDWLGTNEECIWLGSFWAESKNNIKNNEIYIRMDRTILLHVARDSTVLSRQRFKFFGGHKYKISNTEPWEFV